MVSESVLAEVNEEHNDQCFPPSAEENGSDGDEEVLGRAASSANLRAMVLVKVDNH